MGTEFERPPLGTDFPKTAPTVVTEHQDGKPGIRYAIAPLVA